MADIVDIADREIERSIERTVHNARVSIAARMMKPNGSCRFCSEPLLKADALFCDSNCAEDHEKLMWQRSQKPMGKLA